MYAFYTIPQDAGRRIHERMGFGASNEMLWRVR
jgi:hypothetical protein